MSKMFIYYVYTDQFTIKIKLDMDEEIKVLAKLKKEDGKVKDEKKKTSKKKRRNYARNKG